MQLVVHNQGHDIRLRDCLAFSKRKSLKGLLKGQAGESQAPLRSFGAPKDETLHVYIPVFGLFLCHTFVVMVCQDFAQKFDKCSDLG